MYETSSWVIHTIQKLIPCTFCNILINEEKYLKIKDMSTNEEKKEE